MNKRVLIGVLVVVVMIVAFLAIFLPVYLTQNNVDEQTPTDTLTPDQQFYQDVKDEERFVFYLCPASTVVLK